MESVDFSAKVDKLSQIRLLQGGEKACKTSCKMGRPLNCAYVNYVNQLLHKITGCVKLREKMPDDTDISHIPCMESGAVSWF